MRQRTLPLDPDSDGGKAAAHALTVFLASVGPGVRRRRRERLAAQSSDAEQKAA